MSTVEEGRWAEDIAVRHLEQLGYEIVERNFYFKKIGEIDIVARSGNTLVFVEVRHRTSTRYGSPEASLSLIKCAKIRRCAEAWLARHKQSRSPCRFDVIAVDTAKGQMDVRHHINAF
ncbi:MAG: YraN family protein [Candidatus Kapabacteria bacterium]|nr:YraN family protein [Candidatus Kapabacteria bacterium]